MMSMMDPITPASTPPLSSPVEPVSRDHSLASVFTLSTCSADKSHLVSTARCPHCLETVSVSRPGKPGELTPPESPQVKEPLKLKTSGFDDVKDDADSATSNLLKTLHDTNNELRTHCRDLHQIRLMNPSPEPSRRGSIHLLPEATPSEEPQGFQSGHPLICDLGDLVNLSSANFRLLKTLQDKVNRVDWAEKMLRVEREAVEREREQLKRMSAEVEKERVRLMAGGLGWNNYRMDRSRTQSPATISRNRSGGATPDGTWDDMTDIEIYDEEWTVEKEQYLAELESKLKKAHREWSDEQEEILGPLEKLREEKRQEAKARKLERSTSIRFERTNSREELPRKKSNDGAKSPLTSTFKNSLSNIRRKSSVGSLVRRDSSPSVTSQKIFKKWFP